MKIVQKLIIPLMLIITLCAIVVHRLNDVTPPQKGTEMEDEHLFVWLKVDSLDAAIKQVYDKDVTVNIGRKSYEIEYRDNILLDANRQGALTDLDTLRTKVKDFDKSVNGLHKYSFVIDGKFVKCPVALLQPLLDIYGHKSKILSQE